MVDKPGRRKKSEIPWGKIGAGIVIALVAVAAGWYVYWNYVYTPAPAYARIGTSLGYFDVELYPACAPKTVSNFLGLAGSGFYNNLVWHRIIPKFVIQTGDPNSRGGLTNRSGWGNGGSNQTVPLETCAWLHNYAGYLGMARSGTQTTGLNTGTSQFYIILANDTNTQNNLDGYYTVFGKVISGMKVVCAISHVPTYTSQNANQPINPIFMKNVTVISSGAAPTPEKVVACT
jgi:peptidyl-prolyl cis-trans isomerase B (cyclophilin B)